MSTGTRRALYYVQRWGLSPMFSIVGHLGTGPAGYSGRVSASLKCRIKKPITGCGQCVVVARRGSNGRFPVIFVVSLCSSFLLRLRLRVASFLRPILFLLGYPREGVRKASRTNVVTHAHRAGVVLAHTRIRGRANFNSSLQEDRAKSAGRPGLHTAHWDPWVPTRWRWVVFRWCFLEFGGIGLLLGCIWEVLGGIGLYFGL
jgi:hypothetical protein